ncbi:hypothetical protein DUI87_09129 [Hirundo rustica rustica]|uniref:Uncharacterized protein n=1 Tax=Hirundo rustica rustica TaxID=333673 RepID=A0A3M0KLB7_HIRRU|nr:hypothetical protein DUI87_09129 [Hirundo rustica rustica]
MLEQVDAQKRLCPFGKPSLEQAYGSPHGARERGFHAGAADFPVTGLCSVYLCVSGCPSASNGSEAVGHNPECQHLETPEFMYVVWVDTPGRHHSLHLTDLLANGEGDFGVKCGRYHKSRPEGGEIKGSRVYHWRNKEVQTSNWRVHGLCRMTAGKPNTASDYLYSLRAKMSYMK